MPQRSICDQAAASCWVANHPPIASQFQSWEAARVTSWTRLFSRRGGADQDGLNGKRGPLGYELIGFFVVCSSNLR